MPSTPVTPMLTAVLDVARRQLGEVGPAALSLRSIAREVGVVPSALYRYLPGRGAILTQLIQTGYQRLGQSVRDAEAAHSRDDHPGRWLATWRATRNWAVAHPHEYALLYGTPVAGYRAPSETVGPATQVVLTLAQVAVDARTAGAQAPVAEDLAPAVAADADAIVNLLPELGMAIEVPVDPQLVMLVIDAWTTLYGAISFELFGHYERSVSARAEHLDLLARRRATALGIGPDPDGASHDRAGAAQSQA